MSTLIGAMTTDSGGRNVNEDCIDEFYFGSHSEGDVDGLCAVLADGLGGHGGGDKASREAVNVIRTRCNRSLKPEELQEVILQANEQVLALQTPKCKMKSTLVILLITADKIIWGNVGDSRLYRFLGSSLAWQTRDHSAAQVAVMLGQIDAGEMRSDPNRSRLFKCLGQDANLKPDTGKLEHSSERDAYLLCSDGFWEYVLEEEMERTLAVASSPTDWLTAMCAIRDGRRPIDCDNSSAVVAWIVG